MKLFRLCIFFLISMSIVALTACGADVTDSTSQGESIPSESGSVSEPSPTLTPAPIDTESIVPLASPVIYAANMDGVRLYTDKARTTVLRSLTKGEQVTVTGQSNQYVLTSDEAYVNLLLLTAIGPVVVEPTVQETATPEPTETIAVATPSPTPKPKTATPTPKPATQTTTAVTTPTPTTVATTTGTWYTENPENIRNLVIAKLQEKGLWYPDAEVIGWDWKSWSLGYGSADELYAESYVEGKMGCAGNTFGVTSVTVTIWVDPSCNMESIKIETTACSLPETTPAA